MSKKTKVKAKRPTTKYTIEYFFKKFSAIPERLWIRGELENGEGACCALGHLGVRDYENANTEALALGEILKPLYVASGGSGNVCPENVVWDINDNLNVFGKTPKERILTALAKAATR